jgi:predicted ribosome quality control (RQC) complex YloA/Tae2 family protein
MGFDGLMLRRLTSVFAPKLIGARVNKVGKLNKTDFIFLLYKDMAFNLVVSLDSNGAYFNVDEDKYQLSVDFNHFLNLIKTHLEGALIRSFEQIGLDRLIKIKFSRIDEANNEVEKYIIIELTGKRLNLILCKDDLKIIDAYAKESFESTSRLLLPGAIYTPLMNQTLADPLIREFDNSLPASSQFYGISPLIESEIATNKFNREEFKQFIESLLSSKYIYIGSAKKRDFHLLPLSVFETQSIQKYPISEGINVFFKGQNAKKESSELGANLLQVIKKQSKRVNSKLEKFAIDLNNANNFETYKNYGELIYTYGKDQINGLKEIKINDPATNKLVTIQLDNKISLFKNAERYFMKYQKAKKSIDVIKQQIEEAQIEGANLDYLAVAVVEASSDDLKQIEQELIMRKYILAKPINKKKKEEKIKIREYFTPSGVKISVGKSNIQNDHLTFKVAKNHEFFFHVKDYPGAHVIAHTDTLNEEVIRFAANLAAYNSKAKTSSSVPVDYCQVKYIKKPKNYTPGLVLISNYKTIYIDPTPIKD